MSEKKYVGSIEAGGTKFIVAVQDVETGKEVARDRIPTTTNKETLEKTAEFFKKHPVDALGIGTFGPIDINPKSKLMAIFWIRQSQVGQVLMLRASLKKNQVFLQ